MGKKRQANYGQMSWMWATNTCRGPYISKNIALCILKEIAVYLTSLPLDKMDAISQTVCSDSLTWMERFVNWVKIHLRWFRSVQFTITQPWFRKWLGAEYMTSHYLNQFWPDSLTHICGTMGRWVKYISWYRWIPMTKNRTQSLGNDKTLNFA